MLDLTVVGSEAAGFAALWPCDAPRPDASNLNFGTGVDVANTAITKLAADGTVCLHTSATAHYVIDLQGRYP